MKKLTLVQFIISRSQKKKNWSALEENLWKNVEEKALKKSWKNWTARSARNSGLVCNSHLADKARLSVQFRSVCRSDLAREGPREKPKARLAWSQREK